MTEDRFWQLIDQARASSAASAPPKRMKAVLEPLSTQEVTEFGTEFYGRVIQLNQWRLWAAGYVITGGMSDDSFHYFRSWIVGKGREVFALALSDPDSLGPYVDDPEAENELLEYVTIEILRARGSDVDPRDLTDGGAESHDTVGEPFDEESVYGDFPKLTAQFA